MNDHLSPSDIAKPIKARRFGWAMLLAGVLMALWPETMAPYPTVDLDPVGWTWIFGSILLVTPGAPDRIAGLTRRQIGFGFLLMGLAAPFLVNFINSALGD